MTEGSWLGKSGALFARLFHTSVARSAGVFSGCANVFARESPMLKLPEERRKWEIGPRTYPEGFYFFSPQSSTVKDGGYNNTNTNKVSPTQNEPAPQANTSEKCGTK